MLTIEEWEAITTWKGAGSYERSHYIWSTMLMLSMGYKLDTPTKIEMNSKDTMSFMMKDLSASRL